MEHNQHSTLARGTRGFFSGLRSGLLMMGIFTLLVATITVAAPSLPFLAPLVPSALGANAGFMAALSYMLPTAVLGTLATSAFGAVNAVMTAPQTVTLHGRDGMMRTARVTQASPVAMPIVMGQGVAAERSHETQHAHMPEQQHSTGWAERVGRGHKDRISEILANGSMSDKDRASALQAERAQASTDIGRA